MGLLSSLRTLGKNSNSKSQAKPKGEDKVFPNDFGYFTTDGKEYVINNPHTPKPWVNVICNGQYGLTISQVGGGFSWIDNSSQSRITRWNQDLVREDWGKYVYIRDDESGDFWSATFKPTHKVLSGYECRHGVGYTTFKGEYSGIYSEKTIFVPPGEKCEVWLIKLKNNTNKKRSLSLFTYFEWLLGMWPDAAREFHRLFLETEYDENIGLILARKRFWEVKNESGQVWNNDYPYTGFHWSNRKPVSIDCDKTSFLGRNGRMFSPHSVVKGVLNNYTGKWDDASASLHVKVDLEPGAEEELIFILGVDLKKEDIVKTTQRINGPEAAKKALEETKVFWNQILDGLSIETPDDAMNFHANTWLKYQAISSRIWGRCGYYQSSGAFGYRDQLQDSQLFLPLDPERTRKQILLHAEHQLADGSVLHWWQPGTDEGPVSKHSDGLLWLPFVAVNYIKETGDFSIMNEQAKFYGRDNEEAPVSLYEHCRLSINRVLSLSSPRGLPLIFEGDWNDGLNGCGRKGKGESVWLGHFLYGVMMNFIPVAEKLNDKPFVHTLKARAITLKESINEVGWDGEWFWRASADDGSIIGSAQNEEAKIFLNAQTWAIIHNVTDKDRAQQIKKNMEKHLFNEHGPLLFYPSFKKPAPEIGYLTRYAPGCRENGGLYTHAGVWAVMAECVMKDAAKAYETFNRISSIRRGLDPERYQCEPYVLPGNVDGPDSPFFGKGGWTWYTGSAAWFFRIITEWILGIRPEYKGLLVDPCIPSEWDGFNMTRRFRGDTYRIQVKNPDHKSHGIKALKVDGQLIKGNLIIPVGDGKLHQVEAILG